MFYILSVSLYDAIYFKYFIVNLLQNLMQNLRSSWSLKQVVTKNYNTHFKKLNESWS